jgi:hypothetical protein
MGGIFLPDTTAGRGNKDCTKDAPVAAVFFWICAMKNNPI